MAARSTEIFRQVGLAEVGGAAIVAAITSNVALADAPGNVMLPARSAGLSRDSVVNVSQTLEEFAQNGHGVKGAARRSCEFFPCLAARIRALCASKEHAQNGHAVKRAARGSEGLASSSPVWRSASLPFALLTLDRTSLLSMLAEHVGTLPPRLQRSVDAGLRTVLQL